MHGILLHGDLVQLDHLWSLARAQWEGTWVVGLGASIL